MPNRLDPIANTNQVVDPTIKVTRRTNSMTLLIGCMSNQARQTLQQTTNENIKPKDNDTPKIDRAQTANAAVKPLAIIETADNVSNDHPIFRL